ncbi:hypothetical protein LZ318_08265 [Saccharopolyspora indica]|uniref:Rv2732c family membrane protein n=1 Tax=Saccharopolyspora indica TaxID=1229659 RepID=UPI0022EA132D|nr:hypothetical protein [Saccharopolyspora indica]MDA3649630.1 hypothetical protein [Saccharopolyspora indica]
MQEAMMSEAEDQRQQRAWLRRIDPGARAMVIAPVMLVLVVSAMLPWAGDAAGWEVLTGQADPALKIGLLPWLFAVNSTVVGLGFGTLALITRRWLFAFVAGLAGLVVAFEGVIAIWSRQTSGQHGPAFGLVIAAVCMVVLAIQWIKVIWSRD